MFAFSSPSVSFSSFLSLSKLSIQCFISSSLVSCLLILPISIGVTHFYKVQFSLCLCSFCTDSKFYYASLTSSILPHVCKGGSLPSSYLMNYGWNGFLQIARRNVLTTKPHVCRCTHVQDDFKLIINDRKRKTATHNSREVSTSKKLRHDHLGVHNSHLMSKESPRSSNEGRQRSLMNHNLNRIMNIDLIQKQLSQLEQRQQADREELLLIVRS